MGATDLVSHQPFPRRRRAQGFKGSLPLSNRSPHRSLKRGKRTARPFKPKHVEATPEAHPGPLSIVPDDGRVWHAVALRPDVDGVAELRRAGLEVVQPMMREHHGRTPHRTEYERPVLGPSYCFVALSSEADKTAIQMAEGARVLGADRFEPVPATEISDLVERAHRGELDEP